MRHGRMAPVSDRNAKLAGRGAGRCIEIPRRHGYRARQTIDAHQPISNFSFRVTDAPARLRRPAEHLLPPCSREIVLTGKRDRTKVGSP